MAKNKKKNSVGRARSKLGKPIGKRVWVSKSTGEVHETKLYSPKKRTELYANDLKTGTKVDKNGDIVPMTKGDREFRKGYFLAKADEAALFNFKKNNKHRS